MLKRLAAVAAVLFACGAVAPAAQAIHLDVRPGVTEGEGAAGAPDGTAWVMTDTGFVAHVPLSGPIEHSWRAASDSTLYRRLTYGSDGNLWMTHRGLIARYTTAGVPVPIDTSPAVSGAGALTPGPGAEMWFTMGDQIGEISREGHITLHGGLAGGAAPASIAFGPDGNVWFTEPGISAIGRLTPSGQVTEFTLPQTTTFGVATLASGMAFGADGNLYVELTKAILRVTTAGIVTGTLDGGQGDLDPQGGLVAGTDGAVWFAEPSKDRVSRLTLDGTITHFSQGLEHGGRPTGLNRGADGTMWFYEFNTETAVRIVIDPPLAVTAEAADLGDGRFRLSGLAATRGTPASVTFEYGPTTAYGATTAAQAAPDGDAGQAVSADTGALAAGTIYHYRIVAGGNGGRTVGDDQTFTTPGGGTIVNPGLLDGDADGYPASVDCNDGNAAIHPGAVDTPGDKIDQDCAGGDAKYPRFAPAIDATWNTHKGYIVFSRLAISFMPAHTSLKITCKGKGCRLKSYSASVSRARHHLNLLTRLKQSRLRRGAVLELRVSRPGYQSTLTRWTIGPPPKLTTLCQPPGAKKPQRCG